DRLEELFAAKVLARALLAPELLLDHVLGRDPGVVHARDVERLAPFHALPADDAVADRLAQHVPHGERSRDVRRRNGDHERRLGAPGHRGRGLPAPPRPRRASGARLAHAEPFPAPVTPGLAARSIA